LQSNAVNEKKNYKVGERLNAVLQNKEKPRALFPFIPEESESDCVAVQKLIFYFMMIFQKHHEN